MYTQCAVVASLSMMVTVTLRAGMLLPRDTVNCSSSSKKSSSVVAMSTQARVSLGCNVNVRGDTSLKSDPAGELAK